MEGITDASSNPNLVIGNLIGTNVYGTGPLGNGQAGVFFASGVPGYQLGGPAPGEFNTIAFNGGPGIGSVAGRQINFRGNSVYSNGGLGIDRGNDGVTPNQPPGTFVRENFPILTAATTSPAGTSVSGTLASGYAATFTIHVFANPSCIHPAMARRASTWGPRASPRRQAPSHPSRGVCRLQRPPAPTSPHWRWRPRVPPRTTAPPPSSRSAGRSRRSGPAVESSAALALRGRTGAGRQRGKRYGHRHR